MVDSRGRLTLTLKPSHQKKLRAILGVTGADESEVFLDALNHMYREMIRSGEIPVPMDNDVAVRIIRKITQAMGNVDEDLEYLDKSTAVKTDGKNAVNVRMT